MGWTQFIHRIASYPSGIIQVPIPTFKTIRRSVITLTINSSIIINDHPTKTYGFGRQNFANFCPFIMVIFLLVLFTVFEVYSYLLRRLFENRELLGVPPLHFGEF